jgi:phosphoenolpyruvate phosphomutase
MGGRLQTMASSSENGKAAVLRRLLLRKEIVRVVGAHDGISARLGEAAGFDAVWASGLGISAVQALPDCGILTMTEFLAAGEVIDRAVALPVIADCDTGFGEINIFRRAVQRYERAGIAAICIEDKQLPKRNSYREGHRLADPDEFAARIAVAKDVQEGNELVLIARLESLIVGAGLEDALERAKLYAEAGADALLVHSKARTPHEVLDFARAWRGEGGTSPLIVVPTTYPDVTPTQLEVAGIAVVIYANQSLRAAIEAMRVALGAVAEADSTIEAELDLATVQEVLALVGTHEAEELETRYEQEVAGRQAIRRRGANGRVYRLAVG